MHPWRTLGRAIPRSGCSPAEPASVSPDGETVTTRPPRSKSRVASWSLRPAPDRCTPEPRWARFTCRGGPLLLADYHQSRGVLRQEAVGRGQVEARPGAVHAVPAVVLI